MAKHVPAHLSASSKRLYKQLVADYCLQDEPAALTTLRLACEALDRCEQARKVLDAEGLTIVGAGGGQKTHPAVAVERDARLAAVRCLRELSLDPDVGGGYESAMPPRVGSGKLN